MFSCKLNKNYKQALKNYKVDHKEPTDEEIRSYYNIRPEEDIKPYHREDYSCEEDDWQDDYIDHNIDCCGMNELIFGELSTKITRDTPTNRSLIARRIAGYNNDDSRILITGLPIKKVGGGLSDYTFKNYRIIRKILLSFGFKQVHSRAYKNANSNNLLSVLVGQF